MTRKKQFFLTKSYLFFNKISFQLDALNPTIFQHFDASLVIRFVKASKVAIGFPFDLYLIKISIPGDISLTLGTDKSRWGPDLKNKVGRQAIRSVIHWFLPSFLSICELVHCLARKMHFFFNKWGRFLVISSFKRSNNTQ